MNAQVRDALVAVRLIRKRLDTAQVPEIFKITLLHSLTIIKAALEPKTHEPDPVPAVEPPPTNRELEDAVVRSALEIRRIRNRLRGFGAPWRAYSRELTGPHAQHEDAVNALAVARGYQ